MKTDQPLRATTFSEAFEGAAGLDPVDLLRLHRVSDVITRLLDPVAIAQATTDSLPEFFAGPVVASIVLADTDGPLAIAHTRRGLAGEALPANVNETVTEYLRGAGSGGVIRWVLEHGTPVRLANAHADRRYKGFNPEVASELCVPIRVVSRVAGAINVESVRQGAFTENDETVLRIVANQVGAALENARLVNEARDEVAERLRAERALRASERRYRELFESNPHPMWVYDRESLAFLAVNDAAVARYGYSREEFLVMTLRDIRPTEDVALLERDVADAPAGYNRPTSWRHRIEDGRLIDVEISSQPIDFDDRDAKLVLVNDVTERRRLEVSAQARERRFRKLLENGADMVALLDADGVVRFASDSVRRVLGYSADAFVADGLRGLLHEDDQPRFEQCIEHLLLRPMESRRVELRVRHAEGRDVYLEVRLRNLLGDDDVAALVANAHDVTQRHFAEAEQRLHSAVVESTRDGIVVTDLGGRVLDVNRAFVDITGYPARELLGHDLAMLRSERHDEGFHTERLDQLKRRGHWQGEIWNRCRDGSVAPHWLSMSTVYDETGRPTHYVGSYTDISQLKASQARTEWLASYDPLTELPNRVLLMRRLEHAIDRACRHDWRIGALYIDLDRFKNVNDSFGHAAGDELLRAVSSRLRGRLRDEDTIGRLGGDEFLVVLESMDEPSDAARLADELLELLNRDITIDQHRHLHIDASIGISLYPDDTTDAAELVRNADAAMYLAKEQGRRTYRFYSRKLTEAAQLRLDTEMRLRGAIAAGELALAFQPLVDLRDGRVIGAEALLRWTPSDGSPVPPTVFIPVAEDAGLILPIGQWVVHSACRQLREWRDAGHTLDYVAVNVSPRQLDREGLEDDVRAAVQEFGIEPGALELEITESGIFKQIKTIEQRLHSLKALGVRLAIDDFGTGYSSLAHLKRFPVDKLKIDRSFVSGLPDDSAGLQIASAVISMGHSLGLEVLAEGVETETQRRLMAQRGCDCFQGFLVSPALPAAEFARRFLAAGG